MQWRASVHIMQSLEERWRCPHQIVDETIAPMKHYTGFIPLCLSDQVNIDPIFPAICVLILEENRSNQHVAVHASSSGHRRHPHPGCQNDAWAKI